MEALEVLLDIEMEGITYGEEQEIFGGRYTISKWCPHYDVITADKVVHSYLSKRAAKKKIMELEGYTYEQGNFVRKT